VGEVRSEMGGAGGWRGGDGGLMTGGARLIREKVRARGC